MTPDVTFAKRTAYYRVGSDYGTPTYQRGLPMHFKGRRYDDAGAQLSVLIHWYWSCLDESSVIVNGISENEAQFLFDVGVFKRTEPHGIHQLSAEDLPGLVALADAISIRLRGHHVQGPCMIGGGVTRFFEGRGP